MIGIAVRTHECSVCMYLAAHSIRDARVLAQLGDCASLLRISIRLRVDVVHVLFGFVSLVRLSLALRMRDFRFICLRVRRFDFVCLRLRPTCDVLRRSRHVYVARREPI